MTFYNLQFRSLKQDPLILIGYACQASGALDVCVQEAKAQATILEMVGDLPDADVAPPGEFSIPMLWTQLNRPLFYVCAIGVRRSA